MLFICLMMQFLWLSFEVCCQEVAGVNMACTHGASGLKQASIALLGCTKWLDRGVRRGFF